MKIVHISDLHFGFHEQDIANIFIKQIHTIMPEVVIVSGDLTQRARPYQFQMLQNFLQQLPGTVLTVPGNHDIPLYNPFARIFYPFKNYKKYINQNLEIVFDTHKSRIIGISSVNPRRIKEGHLPYSSLKKLEQLFTEAKKEFNVLFFHHNFDQIEGLHKPLYNDKQFLCYLKNSPINIVCTGHLHYANLSVVKKNDFKPCLVLHAGSLLCRRSKDKKHSYFIMDYNNGHCMVEWHVLSHDHFKVEQVYEFDFSVFPETSFSSSNQKTYAFRDQILK